MKKFKHEKEKSQTHFFRLKALSADLSPSVCNQRDVITILIFINSLKVIIQTVFDKHLTAVIWMFNPIHQPPWHWKESFFDNNEQQRQRIRMKINLFSDTSFDEVIIT